MRLRLQHQTKSNGVTKHGPNASPGLVSWRQALAISTGRCWLGWVESMRDRTVRPAVAIGPHFSDRNFIWILSFASYNHKKMAVHNQRRFAVSKGVSLFADTSCNSYNAEGVSTQTRTSVVYVGYWPVAPFWKWSAGWVWPMLLVRGVNFTRTAPLAWR